MNKNILFSLLIMSFGASFAADGGVSMDQMRKERTKLMQAIDRVRFDLAEQPDLDFVTDEITVATILSLQDKLSCLRRDLEAIEQEIFMKKDEEAKRAEQDAAEALALLSQKEKHLVYGFDRVRGFGWDWK